MANFTSEKMRDMASVVLEDVYDDVYGSLYHLESKFDKNTIAEMLRQAADTRERLDEVIKAVGAELIKQEHCRKCEWRGKSIRGEPACPCDDDAHGVVFDIDVTDRIVKALRVDIEREEKRYEYEVLWDYDNSLFFKSIDYSYVRKKMAEVNADGRACHLVRREVGEWEEVQNED